MNLRRKRLQTPNVEKDFIVASCPLCIHAHSKSRREPAAEVKTLTGGSQLVQAQHDQQTCSIRSFGGALFRQHPSAPEGMKPRTGSQLVARNGKW